MAHIFTPALRRPLSKPFARSGTRTPIQRAIASLRARGTDAHLWLPGVGTINGLTTGNYLESTGNTVATVDNPTGLVLDALGTVGVELVTNGGFDSDTGWTKAAGVSIAGGVATFTTVNNSSAFHQSAAVELNKFYKITAKVTVVSGCVRPKLFGGSSLGLSITASGTYTFYDKVASANFNIGFDTNSDTFTGSVDSFSVREVTGIHLTQGTTANKPLLRRGALNLLTYSQDLSNAAWAKTAGGTGTIPTVTSNFAVAPDGTTTAARIQFDRGASATSSDNSTFAQAYSGVTGTQRTVGFWAKLNTGSSVSVYANLTGLNTTITVTNEWQFFSLSAADVSTISLTFRVGLRGVFTSSQTLDLLFWHPQLELGSTASAYSPTTSAAASNPDAGRYSWSFDGSNDSLLTGNLGITNACTIVIAGRLDSLAAVTQLLTEAAYGMSLYVPTSGAINFGKVAASDLVASSASSISAGVPFVITARLSGGAAVIRKNGVQIATAATAAVFAATTGARIGSNFAGSANVVNGSLGNVLAMPLALTDAECLLVERMAASQFPNGPVF